MTEALEQTHLAPPRTDGTAHPARMMLHGLRPSFAAVIRRRWQVEVRGIENFPKTGPAIVFANHIGWLDGPMMAIISPRPVHALTKREIYHGPMSAFLTGAGQIPVWRDQIDPAAIRTTLRVLRDGGLVGVFPEGTRGSGELLETKPGAAYFALVTGAPVVPLAMLGSRLAGGAHGSLPPAGSRIVMTYGEPVRVDAVEWPRRKTDVRRTSDRLVDALRETIEAAEASTGINLPGPIPELRATTDD